MQLDFHFYCTAVLARAAGFSSREALLIGYCAQYVDDATESETIHIQVASGQPAFPFEPTCTSYNLLDPTQGLGPITWAAQKRIFIPFHFIPPHPLDLIKPNLPFSYITEPHSPFAEFLLNEAARDKHPVRRLCRIGIALHTYADTWAHRGFTGKRESANDIEKIQARDPKSGEWVTQVLENFTDRIMPPIGHLEALYFPDIPYIEWRCKQTPNKVRVGGYNAYTFLEAAQWMYHCLRRLQGRICASERLRGQTVIRDLIHWENKLVSYIPWKELSPLILERLQERPEVEAGWLKKVNEIRYAAQPGWRCKNWQKAFGAWFTQPHSSFPLAFDYDKIAFRNDAIEGQTEWDDITPSEWKDVAPFQITLPPRDTQQTDPIDAFWNKPWVQFHRGALMQRNLVAERIP